MTIVKKEIKAQGLDIAGMYYFIIYLSMIQPLNCLFSGHLIPKAISNWAQLFKTNEVVCKRFVKISNVNILNLPIFFVEKV